MVIVVRKDLKLSPGKMAAQVGHAAVNLALAGARRKDKAYEAWLSEGQKKVVVKGEGLRQLYELKEQAEALGLATTLVSDAGLTEVEPGTTTCLGVGPAKAKDVDRVTGGLALA
ncbi:MAG: peptidyl-tRNA hydrolase [Euryarchaeota archaeon]|nr:peptidyl-tRNA hydrolase [Euryarchaeota archaeon]